MVEEPASYRGRSESGSAVASDVSLPYRPDMRNTSIVALCLAAFLFAACGDDPPEAEDAGAITDLGEDAVPDAEEDALDLETDPDPEDTADADEDTGVTDVLRDAEPTFGEGIFSEGCPVPGRSTARQIQVDASLEGGSALGGLDDYLLMNDHSAFIIQDVRYTSDLDDEVHTWWYYGGQPIDAVAMRDCAQTGPERFDEMGFILGTANVAQLDQSVLRGFRADDIEVIADGSDGGPSIVRATGTDDRFWLVELELVRRAFAEGRPTGLSDSLGTEIVVDYILEPDSPVLRMELTIRNTSARSQSLIAGMINFFGDGTTVTRFSRSSINQAGFNLPVGIPWLSGTTPEGTWTVAMESAVPLTLAVSGVDALIDLDQFIGGASIRSGGERTDTYFFAVGEGGLNTTLRHMHALDPEPSNGLRFEPAPLSVQVTDAVSGEGLEGAHVVVETTNDGGDWQPVDAFYVDADGNFEGVIPDFVGNAPYRLRTSLGGRPRPDAVEFVPGTAGTIQIALERAGTLSVDVLDDGGRVLPAKVIVWSGSRQVSRVYHVAETALLDVPPGDYQVSVTRGFEYSPLLLDVTITADETSELDVVLERLLDTEGYMSMDGHIHGGPSPDSGVTIPDRLVTLAGEGLEIAVSTDHENMIPWAPYIPGLGLEPWINTVLGAEVTATLPEHSNAYPFSDLTDEHPRGRPVRWYGLAVGEFFAASRARGAEVVALNHPRNGCAYMCIVDYDRMTGEANLEDPTQLGFAPDAELWSWDFDTIEFMNGHASPFVDPSNPYGSGLFEDWMSFHNHGHRIAATGVTDVHGLDAQGSPRNYVVMPTDEPSDFTDDMLVESMLAGRSLVSAGAFARVSLDGAEMGDTVTVDGVGTLDLHVQALPEVNVSTVLVFGNCDEIASIEADSPDEVVKLITALALEFEVDTHVVVAGFGTGDMPRGLRNYNPGRVPRFVTNPIFVDADGDGEFTAPGGKTCEYTLPGDRKLEVELELPIHDLEPVMTPLLHDYRESCLHGHDH